MSRAPRPVHCVFGGDTALAMDDPDYAQWMQARLALDMLFYQRTRGKYGVTYDRMEAKEQNLAPEVKVMIEEFAHVLRHEVF